MTPAQLADQLEDGPGEVRIESLPHMQLLAAALRLAEAAGNWFDQESATSAIEFDRRICVMNSALADYRSARQRLAGAAP